MQKKVTITVDALGNPKIEAHGFNGQGCEKATASFEQLLSGGGEMTREFKPEWATGDETNKEEVTQSW